MNIQHQSLRHTALKKRGGEITLESGNTFKNIETCRKESKQYTRDIISISETPNGIQRGEEK